MLVRKIDSSREMIQARLAEYPRLSITRLYEVTRAAGYAGSCTPLKEYVRRCRQGWSAATDMGSTGTRRLE